MEDGFFIFCVCCKSLLKSQLASFVVAQTQQQFAVQLAVFRKLMHPLKFFSEKYKTFRLPVLTVPNPKMFTFTVIYGKDEPGILTFEILKQGASLKHLQNKHNRANCQLYYKNVHGTTYANKVFISSPLCCISSFSAQCQWCAQDAMPQLLMIFCFHIVIAVLGHGGIAFKHTSAVC